MIPKFILFLKITVTFWEVSNEFFPALESTGVPAHSAAFGSAIWIPKEEIKSAKIQISRGKVFLVSTNFPMPDARREGTFETNSSSFF